MWDQVKEALAQSTARFLTRFATLLPGLAALIVALLLSVFLAIILAIAVRRGHRITAALTLAGLALAFASIWMGAPETPRQVTP